MLSRKVKGYFLMVFILKDKIVRYFVEKWKLVENGVLVLEFFSYLLRVVDK